MEETRADTTGAIPLWSYVVFSGEVAVDLVGVWTRIVRHILLGTDRLRKFEECQPDETI